MIWIYPLTQDSIGKWRFRLEFPTKAAIVLMVTGILGLGVDPQDDEFVWICSFSGEGQVLFLS